MMKKNKKIGLFCSYVWCNLENINRKNAVSFKHL